MSCGARSSCSTSGPSAASIATTSCPTWRSSRRSTRTSWWSSACTRPSSPPSRKPRTSAARWPSTGSSTPSSTTPARSIWNRFGVESWPTLVLIGPDGHLVGSLAGEGHYEQLDRVIGRLVATHKEQGDLNLDPAEVQPRDGAAPPTAPCSTPARSSPTCRASGCSSPTPGTTGSSRPASTARAPSPSATARRVSKTAPTRRPGSTGRRGCALDRRDALRRRHREPRDPGRRPQGAPGLDCRRHRTPDDADPPEALLGARADDGAVEPLGHHRHPRRQGALHRHGRPAPDLEDTTEAARPSASWRARATRTSTTAAPRRRGSPSRAAWPPTATTCSSPIRRSRESA